MALWNTPTEPFRVIGKVYYVGTKGIASYLITGPDGKHLDRHGNAGGDGTDQSKFRQARL
jgi:hypothetical protein